MQCYNCKEIGHYANQCPKGRSKCNATCSKCGEKGHYANQCSPNIKEEIKNIPHKGVTIYVLKLKGGKYYVGKTYNIEGRIEQHIKGSGSAWTNAYPVENVLKVIKNCDEFDEDKYVKKYMHIYGIHNVRGGSYSQIALDDEIVRFLEKEIRTANNECFYCGKNYHFIQDCLQNPNNDVCFSCKVKGHDIKRCPNYNKWNGCTNCGRLTHFAFRCGREEDIFNRPVVPAALHTFWYGVKSFMEYYK